MDLFILAIGAGTFLAILFLLRIVLVWREIRRNRQLGTLGRGVSSSNRKHRHPPQPVSTLIVLGSGGHTTEMLLMTKHLSTSHYYPIHYCKAATDSTSLDRLRTAQKDKNSNNGADDSASSSTWRNHDIPRSREVGQSYWSSIFSTLYAFGFALRLVARLRPRLLLCNGPGTCIPVCLAALLYRILFGWHCRIVFVESYCRVQTLSLTGKLLYRTADLFVVHWKELREKYPETVLTSSFIEQ